MVADVNMDELLASVEEKRKKKKERAKIADKQKKLTKKERQILDMAANTVLPDHYRTVWTEKDLSDLCAWIDTHEIIAIDTETTGKNPFKDDIVGISLYAPHASWYIPLRHKENVAEHVEGKMVGVDYVKCLPIPLVVEKLKSVLVDVKKKLLWHNYKFDFHVLRRVGLRVGCYYDTLVAQPLLDENVSRKLKDLAGTYLGIQADTFSKLFGNVTFDNIPILIDPVTRKGNLATMYAAKDAELTYKLYEFHMKHLSKDRLKEIRDIVFNIEMPFLRIAASAEERGVRVDGDYLVNTVAKQLHAEVEELRQKIWAYTGQINLNSWQQKADVLYNKLKLPRVNKKNPNATDKKTMKKLKPYHPVAGLLLEYNEKNKLTTAFADKLPKEILNGRIHTTFNTTLAVTGRMSCSNPNLQQIPAKVGSLIRNAFIADEGRLLVSIDFSQQELRVLAHVSKCPVLMDVYASGKDVHSMTAVGIYNMEHLENTVTYEQFEFGRVVSSVFRDADGNLIDSHFEESYINHLIEANKLTREEYEREGVEGLKYWAELGAVFEKYRKKAKTVNFGIVYGMSALGLSDTLEISEEEAKAYITSYYTTYPGVKKWLLDMEKFILKNKYSKTLIGRKRRVHNELDSGERWKIGKGVRMGTNSVIQGSSADMVKIASIKLQPLLERYDSHIVLWIHDEIVFDVPENIGMEALKEFGDVMCNALPLDCGIKVDIEPGKKWGQKMSEDDLSELFEEFEDEEFAEPN